jgi:hypothetical protein
MANFKNLRPGQIINMKELAQAALENWDLSETRPSEVKYLEFQAANGDENFELSETTARSFRDEWDLISEYARSSN